MSLYIMANIIKRSSYRETPLTLVASFQDYISFEEASEGSVQWIIGEAISRYICDWACFK